MLVAICRRQSLVSNLAVSHLWSIHRNIPLSVHHCTARTHTHHHNLNRRPEDSREIENKKRKKRQKYIEIKRPKRKIKQKVTLKFRIKNKIQMKNDIASQHQQAGGQDE